MRCLAVHSCRSPYSTGQLRRLAITMCILQNCMQILEWDESCKPDLFELEIGDTQLQGMY